VTGAEAVGEGHERGSLQVGRRADLVVIDTTGPEWTPPSRDPVVNLVWASGSRSITDVVCGGRIVVRAGQCVTVDVDELRARAIAAGARLLARAHLDPRPLWPTV
jgi:5-methylthioadenosine/S-adenosylhomocysteine deaminase